jgi:hypothetical protein
MNTKNLVRFYLTKLKYSSFFRSFARKIWHKYPHIINWEKHRKEIDNIKRILEKIIKKF